MMASYINFFNLLCIVWPLLTVHCDSIPEIVLNGTIKIRFPEDTFNVFHQCLCKRLTNDCEGNLTESDDGYRVAHITERNLNERGGLDFKVYECTLSKTQTNTFNMFTCQRLFGPDVECNETNMLCWFCDNGTAKGTWSNIQTLNVNHLDRMSNIQIITPNNNDSMSPNGEKDDKDDNVPIIAGAVSGAVLIILIIIIILIACRRKKNKSTATKQTPQALKQPSADASGPNLYTTVSHNEEGHLGPYYVEEFSNKPSEIRGKPKKDKDNYDYCTVGFTNTNDLDENAIVIGNGSSEPNYKRKTGPGPYLEKHQFTNDAMYSNVDIDDKGINLSSQTSDTSNAANVEGGNVEYAVVDKSKKKSSHQKPNLDTGDANGQPSSTDSISKTSDNGVNAPVNCEYAQVMKPKPNPKNIYAKLGEEIRDFKNPYNGM